MGSLMQDFKRQASFFLREKIKTARLVLTDVTPAQLLTEDVTNGDSLAQDAHAMRLISRAAFEVDDYERIVHILHHRLSKFETWNWRASYKALVLLEHLLTHGPQRIAEEFECDEDTIRDMATFQYVDDKGFNWGLSVKNKSERVVNLLEDRSYLKEERARARKLTIGIKGFGSFNQMAVDDSSNDVDGDRILRSKSLFFGAHHNRDAVKANLVASDELYTKLLVKNMMAENDNIKGCSHAFSTNEYAMEEDHPFWDKEHQTRVSLLSSV
ncbi:hypothetical protein C2S52_019415 [Perilla frutescens var. hirtella]|nr:hypothetical protein C2S52_019415 [Perilla frutescens var. hirtella]KAH6806311.1 hypothetical protein C2S51_031142 [Perilla frutescens var. frutescens]